MIFYNALIEGVFFGIGFAVIHGLYEFVIAPIVKKMLKKTSKKRSASVLKIVKKVG